MIKLIENSFYNCFVVVKSAEPESPYAHRASDTQGARLCKVRYIPPMPQLLLAKLFRNLWRKMWENGNNENNKNYENYESYGSYATTVRSSLLPLLPLLSLFSLSLSPLFSLFPALLQKKRGRAGGHVPSELGL